MNEETTNPGKHYGFVIAVLKDKLTADETTQMWWATKQAVCHH